MVHGQLVQVRRFARSARSCPDSVLFLTSSRGVTRAARLDSRFANKGREWKGHCLLHTDLATAVEAREREVYAVADDDGEEG